MDFTIKQYTQLLQTLKSQGFSFYTFAEYINDSTASSSLTSRHSSLIILRHDVEKRYSNALRFAQIQHEMDIRGSYYFRLMPKSFNGSIIKQIAALGHEIGYHYDDLSECRGDYGRAYERFKKNLAYLREIAPVKTITMEGAPLSRYDNRDLWRREEVRDEWREMRGEKEEKLTAHHSSLNSKKSYRDFGIIAEPYFDINFNELFYITDTGRRWDGHLFNVRDKATKENPVTNPEFLKLRYRHTADIINALEAGSFPRRAMLNFHPQRWNDALIPWMQELVWQNAKNQVKRFLVRK
ncbi:MAG TPA: hypothetical protein VFC92_07865 [Bacteroidales bacterium]|nr:hypothetical protein [Bacteroidales bacterium]